MDARQLRFFLAVVDNGGITRASEVLYVAQPSVSQTIRRLEEEFGTTFFERSGRGLRLTPAGQALVGPARQIERNFRIATETIGRITSLERGRVDIAVTSELAIDPLADFIAAFRERFAGVWINVLEAKQPAAVADLVRQGACEFGLCSIPLGRSGVTEIPLGDRELVLAMPPGSADSGDSPIPLDEMGDVALVAGPRGDVVRDLIEHEFQAHGVRPRIQVEVDVAAVHADLVLAGVGAAFLPPKIASQAAAQGAIVRSMAPRLVQLYGFVCRQDAVSPATRSFIGLAQEVCESGTAAAPAGSGSHV